MTVQYSVPRKKILTKDDLEAFASSSAYNDLLSFIQLLNESVKGVKLTDERNDSDTVKSIVLALDQVDNICKNTPPVDNAKSRFGNPAFRTFYSNVKDASQNIHMSIGVPEASIIEVSKYFIESWGNQKRIDYGTGHETNFIAWLLCLHKLNLLKKEDASSIVLSIFDRYMAIMRKLQLTYWLEPAGSHGVWGLDDYHFMPFYFGSSQLRGHKYIRPKSIHDKDVVDEFFKDYMYLACIKFINSIKTASLQWHSPMLNDISGVKTWDKVNEGMLKMYKAEVLNKLPIMQHFMCGSLLVFDGGSVVPEDEEEDDRHVHVHAFGEEHPECCGIPVPSAIGAMMSETSAPRRLPFD